MIGPEHVRVMTGAWGKPVNVGVPGRTNRQDRDVEQIWIPMSDGARLAATLYLPDGAGPVPCLLEALPYRKDDLTASYRPEYTRFRDEFGYAVARVDQRGTGSSSWAHWPGPSRTRSQSALAGTKAQPPARSTSRPGSNAAAPRLRSIVQLPPCVIAANPQAEAITQRG
jgi:hypothetical protein